MVAYNNFSANRATKEDDCQTGEERLSKLSPFMRQAMSAFGSRLTKRSKELGDDPAARRERDVGLPLAGLEQIPLNPSRILRERRS